MEARQLRSADRLQRLLGFLAIVAVRLLWLRSVSRRDGDQLACQLIPEPLCQVIAYRLRQPEATLTLRAFWRAVANLGGFLGRKGDGDPGWQTLWKGWRRLLNLAWSTPSKTLSPRLVGNDQTSRAVGEAPLTRWDRSEQRIQSATGCTSPSEASNQAFGPGWASADASPSSPSGTP